MIDPIQGNMAPNPEGSRDLAIRNVKHAAKLLQTSSAEVGLSIQNQNPSKLADDIAECEKSLSIIEKYTETLGAELKGNYEVLQKALSSLKEKCNLGEPDAALAETLKNQVQEFISTLDNL